MLKLSVIVSVVMLVSVVKCFGQNDPFQRAIFELRSQKIPEQLMTLLENWNAVPEWAVGQHNIREDWLESLHSNSLGDDWPPELHDVLVRTLRGQDKMLGFSTPGDHRVVGIFDATPVYLARLQEIVHYPLVRPQSTDPNATMLWHKGREAEAVNQLAEMLGMLRETRYLDGPVDFWYQSVVAGTRFIYYHELGHLVLGFDKDSRWRYKVLPFEKDFSKTFSEELYADSFSFASMVLEVRSYPHLHATMMQGVALAMALVASQEFVYKRYERPLSPIAAAEMRMTRLLQAAEFSKDLGRLDSQAAETLKNHWERFRRMLQKVKRNALPSPTSALIQKASIGGQSEWETARNQIVKWCGFGNCLSVATKINEICNGISVLQTSSAKRGLQLINYVLKEARQLEVLLDGVPNDRKPHHMQPLLNFANHFGALDSCRSVP